MWAYLYLQVGVVIILLCIVIGVVVAILKKGKTTKRAPLYSYNSGGPSAGQPGLHQGVSIKSYHLYDYIDHR